MTSITWKVGEFLNPTEVPPEEIVGVVTIEDVLEQIIGRKIVDEFDQYADLRVVARQLAHKEASNRSGEMV